MSDANEPQSSRHSQLHPARFHSESCAGYKPTLTTLQDTLKRTVQSCRAGRVSWLSNTQAGQYNRVSAFQSRGRIDPEITGKFCNY